MKNVTSIIYISCILLSLCNIHILYAQKITPPDSTTIQQKVTKYGKVKLRTSIMQVSLDAVKANLICGKDTLKEDYKSSVFFSFESTASFIIKNVSKYILSVFISTLSSFKAETISSAFL